MGTWVKKEGDMYIIDASSWGSGIELLVCTQEELTELNSYLIQAYPIEEKQSFTIDLYFIYVTIDTDIAMQLQKMLKEFV